MSWFSVASSVGGIIAVCTLCGVLGVFLATMRAEVDR